MAFTGDLEQLHIVDVIQLIHTTRKSGTFSVKGPMGESRVIFSNGYIVGANHLNNRIRIGTVLVKLNTITPEDLKQALEVQKKAKKDRKPLIVTLIESGKLKQEEAAKGLKKLIEITIVELIGWTKGTFTLDTDAISVSPDCSYNPDRMDQTVSLDAQMVLMDALRIYDERERDRNAGKHIPPDEELFAEVIPSDETGIYREYKGNIKGHIPYYSVFCFLGLPGFLRENSLPIFLSIFFTNCSLPNGLPVFVLYRIALISFSDTIDMMNAR